METVQFAEPTAVMSIIIIVVGRNVGGNGTIVQMNKQLMHFGARQQTKMATNEDVPLCHGEQIELEPDFST